jgi:hypothetical protein
MVAELIPWVERVSAYSLWLSSLNETHKLLVGQDIVFLVRPRNFFSSKTQLRQLLLGV